MRTPARPRLCRPRAAVGRGGAAGVTIAAPRLERHGSRDLRLRAARDLGLEILLQRGRVERARVELRQQPFHHLPRGAQRLERRRVRQPQRAPLALGEAGRA